MKLRTMFVCSLVIMVCLGGCGKKERIEGTVQDVFGNPLKDVTIKIENSTFTSVTDNSGHYSLDYAPGSIKLIFSKDGYTTMNLDLNIQQKAHYPAELMVLYPIPEESGMFYIDTEKKQLVKLKPNGKVVEKKTKNKGFSLTMNYRYSVKYSNPVLTIKPGKAQFIDKIPYLIKISKVHENDVIYEGNLNMFERHDKYSGFIKDSSSKLGKEGLLVRTVDLSAGSYAWVEMLKNDMIGAIPKNGGSVIGFKVEGASPN